MNIRPDEWLTVAAHRGESPLGPNEIINSSTLVLRIKGSDLALYDRSDAQSRDPAACGGPGVLIYNRRMFARCSAGALLLAVALAAGCSRSVDVKQALEVADATSGWYDAGIVDGKNKIVPSVTFRLKKKPDADLAGVALNVVFRHPAPPAPTSRRTGTRSSSSVPTSRARTRPIR